MPEESSKTMVQPVATKPAVSVVIPAYNAMVYLPETLESLWKQTFTDFEVVVVDDGSTDNIRGWATSQEDPRFRLVSQENRGLAGARNTGIREARADYVAFLDADDLWEPSKLELQMAALLRSPNAALAYTWSALVDAQGTPTGRVFKSNAEGEVWSDLILENFVGCGSTPVVKRCYFDSLGLFDQNLGSSVEDWDMWLRLALHHPFVAVPQPLVGYRQHENSASRNWRQMERSFNIVLDKAFAAAEEAKIPNLEALRKRAYGNVYLDLAWKPLQCAKKEVYAAREMRARAMEYDPSIWQKKEYWRLSLAINLMQFLGEAGYRRIVKTFYGMRRTASSS